jgi:hypothetical protein
MGDNDPSQGRGRHDLDPLPLKGASQDRAEPLGMSWMLQDQGTLQVLGAMQAGTQKEVAFQ